MSYQQFTTLFVINPDPIFYGMMDHLSLKPFKNKKQIQFRISNPMDIVMTSKLNLRWIQKTNLNIFKISGQACDAINPHLTIGGVDILDSRKNGKVVLEIKSWSEMTFSQEATGLLLLNNLVRNSLKDNLRQKYIYQKIYFIIIIDSELKKKQRLIYNQQILYFSIQCFILLFQIHYSIQKQFYLVQSIKNV